MDAFLRNDIEQTASAEYPFVTVRRRSTQSPRSACQSARQVVLARHPRLSMSARIGSERSFSPHCQICTSQRLEYALESDVVGHRAKHALIVQIQKL